MEANIIDQKIDSPYHLLENYKFPTRTFGKSKRPCPSSWFKTYKWRHYVTKNAAVICHICANQEFRDNLRSETKKDPAFFSKGYSNWKKAIEKFEGHQKFS